MNSLVGDLTFYPPLRFTDLSYLFILGLEKSGWDIHSQQSVGGVLVTENLHRLCIGYSADG